jgi:hypothetical protein
MVKDERWREIELASVGMSLSIIAYLISSVNPRAR